VGAQIVRFRFLNAETERAYNLGFDDQRTFWVVGTDGGLVDSPVGVTRLRILPGERYEVLFDLTKESIGASVSLKSFNSGQGRGFPGAEPSKTGEEGSILNNIDFEVLNLKIKATTEAAVLKVPVTLVKNVFPQLSEVTTSRTLLISDRGGRGPGRTYTFDGSSYDMMRIDQVVKLGSVEAWTIRNSFESGHAFHIHDVQFEIESRSTGPVEAFETGWKDTFYIAPNERVTFVARFADYADAVNPYMYHCHMTNHEDGGLRGQFVVK
jgi:bilirubin oxidase